MSTDTHVQFKDVVHHEMSIQELAEAMTGGQMVHMANHLYKHYGVGAQKLLNKIPTEDDERAYKMIDEACDYWKEEAERLGETSDNWRSMYYAKTPEGKRVNVDGVDYILVRDGE